MQPPNDNKAIRRKNKFANALRGVGVAVSQENSFYTHLPVAALVIFLAWRLGVSRTEWLLLTLCIAAVVSAEIMNTAIERLAKAVTREENPHVRDALDAAGGAVLLTVIGAAVVGLAVFLPKLFG